MHFSQRDVEDYLNIVQDDNPIHTEIVPGQLVVETVWIQLNMRPRVFHVQYQKPIMIDECLEIHKAANTVSVYNKEGEGKITIKVSE
ncbi:hypothetical protein [Staphylococcus sp. 11261D007BR]